MFAIKPRVMRAVCAFTVVTSHFAWQSFFFTYLFLPTPRLLLISHAIRRDRHQAVQNAISWLMLA